MPPTPGRGSIGVRVRPNANDFLVDLERQLKTKKKTFYVDVHANMSPANRDIAAWAKGQLKKINAVVPVNANMSQATIAVTDWRRKQRTIKTKIPVEANLAAAYAQVLAFRKVAGKDIEVNLRVNTRSADLAAERFSQAIARKGVKMPLDLNINQASIARGANKIETDLVKRMKAQGGVLIDAHANTDPAENDLRSFSARAPDIQTEVDLDLKRARTKLAVLRAEQLARKLDINVDVKRGPLENFTRTIGQIEKKFGNFNFIRSLDFGPVNLGKPGGLVGTLTTITALAGAVPAATYAVTGLSQGLTDVGAAAAILPGVIGGVLASMSTFSVGVSGMADAFDALSAMWTETPAEAAMVARRSTQAQNQLRQAVREEAQAQRDVGAARREATNDLRNLNNELRGSVLNEAQAILDLQKARDRLAQGGFETATDYAQAQLDVAKADQNVINVRERNLQLQQKVNSEGQKGVEGSDKVTSALERQTRATEQAAYALDAIAASNATSTLGKFMQEVDQLTPSAKDFVLTLAGMRGEFERVRNMVQETMFAGTGPGLRNLFDNLLPVIGPGMQRVAQGMNAVMLETFDTLGGAQGASIIDRIFGGTADAMERMKLLIDPLVRGWGTLMAAGAEHLPQLVDMFTRLSERFATFIETADKNGSLDEFLERGIGAVEKLVNLGVNLIQIVSGLGDSFGGDFLQSLVDVTQKFEDWVKSAEGQSKINELIQQAKDLWADWKPVLEDLPEIFGKISDAARNVLGPTLAVLDKVTTFLAENPGLVEGFVTAWLSVKVLVGAASPIVQLGLLLAKIVTAAKAIPGLMRGVAMPPGGIPGTTPPGTGPVVGAPGGGAGGIAGKKPAFGPRGLGILATLGPGTSEDVIDLLQYLPEDKQKEYVEADKRKDGPTLLRLLKEAEAGYARQAEQHFNDTNFFERLFTFDTGGYTDWGVKQGKMAMLHGGEYVEPHDTVSHYGVDAMKAIHEKRVPKEFLGSFFTGGFAPLQPPTLPPIPPPTPPTTTAAAVAPTPIVGASPGAGTPHMPDVPGLPGPAPTSTSIPGPTIGQQPNSLANTPHGGMRADPASSVNIFGIEVPFGGQAPGGFPGGAPVGLGGGPDGFDMRTLGIGPGPPGSGPGDWGNWIGGFAANALTSLGGALLQGGLGFFGLEGLLNNPYMSFGQGLIGHFASAANGTGGVQAPGAGQTVAGVNSALNTFYNMPVNGATGALGNLPVVIDPATGSAMVPGGLSLPSGVGPEGGLQVNTIGAKRAISAAFPHISSIGGYREDPLPDHPSGQAIDVMLPRDEMGNLDASTGQAVADFALANAGPMGVDYLIYNGQIIYTDGRGAQKYNGANPHTDHVHVHTTGGGYPTDDSAYTTGGGLAIPGMSAAGGTPGYSLAQGPTGSNDATTALDDALSGRSQRPYASPYAKGGLGQSTSPFSNGPLNIRQTDSVMQYQWGKSHPRQRPSMGGKSQTMGMKEAGARPENMASVPLQLGGMNVTDWSKTKGELKKYAKSMYLQAGMPPSEWPAFDRLIEKESSWNPVAQNPTSTAYGLGQFLDITDAQYGPRTENPFVQLPRIFQYIQDRYNGSPAQALKFHNQNNWYDRGGWLMPGQSSVMNGTGKPELVIPMDKLKSFEEGGFLLDLPHKPLGPSLGDAARPDTGRFNPNIKIDTSHAEVFDPKSVAQGLPAQHQYLAPDKDGNVYQTEWAPNEYMPAGSYRLSPDIFAQPPQLDPSKPGFEGAFMPSFYNGGQFKAGAVQPYIPRPSGPEAKKKIPAPSPAPPVAFPRQTPRPGPSPTPPAAPPTSAPPRRVGIDDPAPTVAPAQIGTGPGIAGSTQDHLHPAISKGINATAATIGGLVDQAVAAAASAGSFGAAGAAGAAMGGSGGGLGGLSIGGIIKQGGKMIEGLANVGASFLVGTVSQGTTENPYGVTQRGSNPTEGTRVVDNSTKYGDVYTQDQESWFRQLDLREAQKAQSSMSNYDRYA